MPLSAMVRLLSASSYVVPLEYYVQCDNEADETMALIDRMHATRDRT